MISNTNSGCINVIYSQSAMERDYLRFHLGKYEITPICFDNETICFENIKTIQPDLLIVQSDNISRVWRFITAIYLLDLNIGLMVISDMLKIEEFGFVKNHMPFSCISKSNFEETVPQVVKDIKISWFSNRNADKPPLFIGQSRGISEIRSLSSKVRDTVDPVLIMGERGTGKEHLARYIAYGFGGRPAFVRINCPDLVRRGDGCDRKLSTFRAICERTAESSEFKANGHSIAIVLHGIDQLTRERQSELLMFLDEAKIAMASDSALKVRFIATSQMNLEELMLKGGFKKELYYRLNVIPIKLPPLRKRKEDIADLVNYFLIEKCVELNKGIFRVDPDIIERFYLHSWPGNIEQLRGVVQRIAVSGDDFLILFGEQNIRPQKDAEEHLFMESGKDALPDRVDIIKYLSEPESMELKAICQQFVAKTERRLMKTALKRTNWNRKKAAQLLNISYKSMLNKMKVYEI